MKLINGDCIEEMALLPANSIDLILTDPPYGTTACKWDSVIPFEPMWAEIWRVLKPNGVVALFGSEPFSSKLRVSQLKYYKYDWIWDTVNKITNYFHAKNMPMRQHEIISIFCKKKCNYYPTMIDVNYKTRKFKKNKSENYYTASNLDINRDVKKGYPRTILSIKGRLTTSQLHPTQKPVALLEYLIKTYTLENETVLDFTMGSGSTGVACMNLNRKFIGIEKGEKYFDIAKERINNAC